MNKEDWEWLDAKIRRRAGGDVERTVESAIWERSTHRHIAVETIVITIMTDGIAHGKHQVHIANKEVVIQIGELSGSIGATKHPQVTVFVGGNSQATGIVELRGQEDIAGAGKIL